MTRPLFRAFTAPAARHPQIWRLILGLLLAALVYLAVLAGLGAAIFALAGGSGAVPMLRRLADADTPAATLLLLATFGGLMLGVFAAARVLQKRRPGTLFGPAPRVLRDFVAAVAVVASTYGLAAGLWALSYDSAPGLDPALWLTLLPLSVLGLLIQTGAEEVLFRGYLTQQLAARFRTPLIWALLPSLAFGVLHFDPVTAGDNAWIAVAAAVAFGLVATDLTALTGSLGAAWGFHFANNALAVLFIATKGTITGLALRQTPYGIAEGSLSPWVVAGDLALLLVAWAILRRILSLR